MKTRPSPLVEVVELSELARAELLGFPAAQLPGLPVPVRIALAGAAVASGVRVIWQSAPRDPISESRTDVVFDGAEVRAIAVGTQAERVRASELCALCLRKLQDPEFRVTEEIALDGARAESGAPWSLDRVLRSLDVEPGEVGYLRHETPLRRETPRRETHPGTAPEPRSQPPFSARSDAVSVNESVNESVNAPHQASRAA